MKTFRFIRKWWHNLWSLNASFSTGIDSHTWDSKIEILANISHRCCWGHGMAVVFSGPVRYLVSDAATERL